MRKQKQSFAMRATETTSTQDRVIELSDFSESERSRALQAFGLLPPGDAVEIVTHRRPGRLFAELHGRYGVGFYWWSLERGPSVWRTMLAKPELDAPKTVAEAMRADHQRLDQLWSELEAAVDFCQIDGVQRRLSELSLGLRRYIDIEEGIIFAVLDGQTGADGARHTAPMRLEHREIKNALDHFSMLCSPGNCAAILQAFDHPIDPIRLFRSHCREEEACLYPFMREVFDSAENRELLLLIQAFEI